GTDKKISDVIVNGTSAALLGLTTAIVIIFLASKKKKVTDDIIKAVLKENVNCEIELKEDGIWLEGNNISLTGGENKKTKIKIWESGHIWLDPGLDKSVKIDPMARGKVQIGTNTEFTSGKISIAGGNLTILP
ncbi:MAG: hypothetical protein WC836_17885, partial [Desulfobacula sp.]